MATTGVVDAIRMECQPGYYADAASSEKTCTECPVGYSCDDSTKSMCSSGEVCARQSQADGGYTAAASPDWLRTEPTDLSSYLTPCPEGKYLSSVAGNLCSDCPVDKKCLTYGGTPASLTTGYYSPSGVNVEFPCPGGFQCDGADAVACATGWYSEEYDLICHECEVGYACPHKELGAGQRIDCTNLRGYYQDVVASVECKIVPPGEVVPYGSNVPFVCL